MSAVSGWMRGVALVAISLSMIGCVERRIFITSEPTGARVWLNDQDVGQTPVEVDFTWFGVYDVRVHKDGFEPMVTSAEAEAPLHEVPGLDLIAMVVPGTDRTLIEWHFTLEPSEGKAEGLVERARELRDQEQSGEREVESVDPQSEPTASPAPPG